MSYKTLETKIVKLIPSHTLREYVKEHKYRFTQLDLLKFAEDYAPTYDEKIKLLNEIATTFPDKSTVKHAQKLIKYHQRTFDEFMTPNDDCVYEVQIYCNPDDKNETYIVKKFDDALILIDNYLKHYRDIGVTDSKLSEYRIIKKTAYPPRKLGDLSCKVGEVGRCILGYKRIIKSVEMDYIGCYLSKSKGRCILCKDECIEDYCPHFPVFLQQYDLVAYKTNWTYDAIDYRGKTYVHEINGEHIVYGILSTDMNKCDDFTHVVLLDNQYIRDRNAFYQDENECYRIYDAHDHPSYAVLFKPDLSQLDYRLLDDYEYAVKALKQLYEEYD